MKIHLIDGTYELFRAHYSPGPGRTSPEGKEVGGATGLFRSLTALLREPDTTHVAIAFDTVIASFRNTLFAGYKSGEGVEQALLDQFPLAEQAAHALGMVVWPMEHFEADDALATAAARYMADPRVEQVLICSPDKDLAQCIQGTQVVSLDRRRNQILDEDGVRAKFGVSPGSIPDYLALVGDSADGIPGIARWGAKSTATVLHHYHHIEAIPSDAAQWEVKVRGGRTLAANLAAQHDDALLYRTLATLRTDVPLPEEDPDALRWNGAKRDAVEAFCKDTGLGPSAVERIPSWSS